MQKLMQKIVSYVHQVLLLLLVAIKMILSEIKQYLNITIMKVVLHYFDFPYKILFYFPRCRMPLNGCKLNFRFAMKYIA